MKGQLEKRPKLRLRSGDGRDVAEVLPLQEEVHLGKPRPVGVGPFPALGHEVVDLPRAVVGPG